MSTQKSPPLRLDCRRLLEAVAIQEAIYRDRIDFGHPASPRVEVGYVNHEALLVAAYTPHFVYAQGMSYSALNNQQPREICRITSEEGEEEEEITCLTIVCLEDETIRAGHEELMDNEAAAGNSCEVQVDEVRDSASPKSKKSLLRGIISPSSSAEYARLAVVIGTNKSRVYSVELRLEKEEGRLVAEEVPYLCEVLPHDDDQSVQKLLHKRKNKKRLFVPFRPKGGVRSLGPFRSEGAKALYVWITFGDGTLIRLHSVGLFPSIWQKGALLGRTLDEVLGGNNVALTRCRVRLPFGSDSSIKTIVPLPRSFPSFLASLPREPWKFAGGNGDESTDDSISEADDVCPSVIEALVFGVSPEAPTVMFYTSEGQFEGKRRTLNESPSNSENPVFDAVVGGTRAIVGGVVGTALGALRWGFGGGGESLSQSLSFDDPQSSFDEDEGVDAAENGETDAELSSAPFPALWNEPIDLFAGSELHDASRQVESCSIEPDGELAAITDNLGRVLLLDLTSKQVFRLWKGYRDATCSWIQTKSGPDSRSSSQQKPNLYLVIHARQRRVLEVWRVRHGPRVSAMQLDKGAAVLPFTVGSVSTQMSKSFLMHSIIRTSSHNWLDEILVEGMVPISSPVPKVVPPGSPRGAATPSSSRVAALKLQNLRQLLSTSSSKLSEQAVYEALSEITALSDLASALDLLAGSPVLEASCGVDGSSFQKRAVSYCGDVLSTTLRERNRDIATNPHVAFLSRKIAFHSRLIKAFDALREFNVSDIDQGRNQKVKPSPWLVEAMGWAVTYEEVTGMDLDSCVPTFGSNILFSSFASACVSSPGKESNVRIYFSDSSRVRRDVIVHVFRPLLGDVFSFKVVNSVFDSLAILDDYRYLLKCFGEWAMTLKIQQLYQRGLSSAQSPLIRFLQDMGTRQLDSGRISDDEVVLDVLYTCCEQSIDLVRSFMLAVMCRDAAETATSRKEKLTYGRILTSRVIQRWEDLLRRLRVSLLVTLRLQHTQLVAPISVALIDEVEVFSVYRWLALDELSMSQNHGEIRALEMACRVSSFAFDPSCSDGDGPDRFKQLQKSCLAASMGENERSEYLIDFNDEDRFGALLLFLRNHNEPSLLAAHRTLLLASKWSKNPSDVQTLRDCMFTLRSLYEDGTTRLIGYSIGWDIWSSIFSPIYRARLFGFDHAQELAEEKMSPLIQDELWLEIIGNSALDLLDLMRFSYPDDAVRALEAFVKPGQESVWPPVREDHILRRIMEKARRADISTLDVHASIVSALLVSSDIEGLVKCVPVIYECFNPDSLENPVHLSAAVREERALFLDEAVLSRAKSYNGPSMDVVELGAIATLSKAWGFNLEKSRTLFLLSMYEVGKDRIVDEILTKGSSHIDVGRFVEGGVDIACRRLHAFLSGKEMQAPDMRETMGMLDADLCEWIKNRARKSIPSSPVVQTQVSIGQTHLFTLRLLSLSASSNVETTLRVKIHALVVLSGTLVKVLEIKAGANAAATNARR